MPVQGSMTQMADSVTWLVTDSVSRDSILQSIELKEVTATAAGNNRDAVTESYIVTDEMRRGNTSAIALLGRVPGVTVNLIDESIRVGKERDVKIIVNGREMNTDFAKSINPKRVFKVEIQRYPPGQFSDRRNQHCLEKVLCRVGHVAARTRVAVNAQPQLQYRAGCRQRDCVG